MLLRSLWSFKRWIADAWAIKEWRRRRRVKKTTSEKCTATPAVDSEEQYGSLFANININIWARVREKERERSVLCESNARGRGKKSLIFQRKRERKSESDTIYDTYHWGSMASIGWSKKWSLKIAKYQWRASRETYERHAYSGKRRKHTGSAPVALPHTKRVMHRSRWPSPLNEKREIVWVSC